MKMKFLIFMCLLLTVQTGFSQSENKKPKIGLVLSGGGAKGLAHIAVLKLLEELGIQPDYITGTSMGSIIGGLYSIGYTADEIEKIAREMDWNDLLEDKISRRDISIEEKTEDGKYIGEFPLKEGKIALPIGIITGQKLVMRLNELTWAVHHICDFDSLPIPFRCIATDLITGNAVVLKSGYLPHAIRASMSIPSALVPFEIDGNLLVDGGLVRNFPVSDVIEMGADIVIGVDVGAPLYKRAELNSVVEVIDQVSSFKGVESTKRERKLCDILITPDVSGYNASSFDYADTLIVRGKMAAVRSYPALKKLADSLKQIGALRKKKIHSPIDIYSVYINKIKIEGLKKVSREVVLNHLQLKAGDVVSPKILKKAIAQVYGSLFFKRVSYRVKQSREGIVLIVSVIEKTSSVIKFGLNYDSDFESAVLLNGTFRNILGNGSRLLVNLRLSKNPALEINYNLNAQFLSGLYLGVNLLVHQFQSSFLEAKNKFSVNATFNRAEGNFSVQSIVSNSFTMGFRAGIEYRNVKGSLQGDAFKNLDIVASGISACLKYDSYEQAFFPHSGIKFYGEGTYHSRQMVNKSEFDLDDNMWSFFLNYKQHIPFGKKITFAPSMIMGTNSKNLHPSYNYILGAQNAYDKNIFPFSGIHFMKVSAQSLLVLAVELRYEVLKNKYITLVGNFESADNNFLPLFDLGNFHNGYGLRLGLNTYLGPVELEFSKSDLVNGMLVKINIGFTF